MEGLKPDPKKISAITFIKLHLDVETLCSFLGIVNYLNRFSPRLAEIIEPLQRLTLNHVPFKWSEEQVEAFQRGKTRNHTDRSFEVFDICKNTVLQTNASKKVLGTVILQVG